MISKEVKKIEEELNYYIFICLDGIPTLELLLDYRFTAIEKYDAINWYSTRYVILDFKSKPTEEVIIKGYVKYFKKIITKKIIYYSIDIEQSQNALKQNKGVKYTKNERNILKLSQVLFKSEPIEFLRTMKEKKLLSKKEILRLEKAFERMETETEILNSWKNISSK